MGNEHNESRPHPSKDPEEPGGLRMSAEDMVGNQGARDRAGEPAEGVDEEVDQRRRQGERRREHPADTGRGRRAADKARSRRLARLLAEADTHSDRRTPSERTVVTGPTGMVAVGGQDG